MAAVLQSFTALGKGLAVAIVAGGVLVQVAPSVEGSLGLIAARAIPRPWTLFSCAFLHANILNSLAYGVAVLFLARIVEPIYGSRELFKYLSIVITLTSFLTVAVVTVLYYATLSSKSSPKADHAGDKLFRPMGGFEAGLAALLVAVKQLIPDNEVALLGGALKFRAKHLPALYAAAMVGGSLALGGAVRVIPFTLFGTYLGWAFLRFVQTRNGVRGDLSDEFRLSTFFPQPLQPPVDQVAGACTRLTGLGASTGSQAQQAAWNYGMGGSVLPGTDDGEAARRRERGAKALEERLGLKKAASASTAVAPTGAQEAAEAAPLPPAEPDVEAGVAAESAS
ncbi:hypothetical protein CHLNCDRAFT_139902 [Chlorella variabilis]|uniref:Peptidase S54 rhomboid domain-containing protein n=1 Tax=Chlorella variabilis TaxID=554065 RepID=E1ZR59_CHLVA|nr:hypothetical protein CHLNCDRAFT_139902 [Chlorella variabilis]EFN51672.1 hypothetical protein CHLNCDRAFT_139902 [Chlorella variabilis]|eukprot:XP_005843774.1 hypothetical protein CHLNCDRAFT_139902 [Chlorella variabilis]